MPSGFPTPLEDRRMPTQVVLHYQKHRLLGIQGADSIWVGEDQLVPPLGYSDVRSLRRLRAKNPGLFTSQMVAPIPVKTSGGTQDVIHYSLLGIMVVAGEAGTVKGQELRIWAAKMMNGQAPVPRVTGEAFQSLDAILAVLATPMFGASRAKFKLAAEREAQHTKDMRALREEGYRLGRLTGLPGPQLRIALTMADAAEQLALQAAPTQPELPLLEG
jgi:hypothetical protein